MGKCECYIHSLKQGEKHVLGEARIIKRLGDNDYLAEYNGVQCHAIFNPFVGKFFVDDVYGIVRKSPADRTRQKMTARGRRKACLLLPGKENAI